MEFLFAVGEAVFRKRCLRKMTDLIPVVDCQMPHSSDCPSGFFTCLLRVCPGSRKSLNIGSLRWRCLHWQGSLHRFSSATSGSVDL
jgi:hypothetical protein